jgi:hypothetical protein
MTMINAVNNVPNNFLKFTCVKVTVLTLPRNNKFTTPTVTRHTKSNKHKCLECMYLCANRIRSRFRPMKYP